MKALMEKLSEQEKRNWTRLLLGVILATLIVGLKMSLCGCAKQTSYGVVHSDKAIIRQMDNGNYEVTESWIRERYHNEEICADILDLPE